jgi:hypothetical protein
MRTSENVLVGEMSDFGNNQHLMGTEWSGFSWQGFWAKGEKRTVGFQLLERDWDYENDTYHSVTFVPVPGQTTQPIDKIVIFND